ncbi:hypothetical protein I7I48_12211 [Histoplasma ohiense]|nr:hypothetical protein I7I48_12211 [Histoplasma ohiense (nom. inval.)]
MASDCCVSCCSDCVVQSIASIPCCQSACFACDCPISSSNAPSVRDLASVEKIASADVVGAEHDDDNTSKAVGEGVGSDGSVCEDAEMMDVSVLSPAAVSSAPTDSPSLTPVNPSLSSHTDSSLSSDLQEALHIFCSPPLYPPHLSPTSTASTKTQFHTQVLYNTTQFTSYLSVTPLA